MSKVDTILEKLKDVRVIDTHEHLWDESYRLQNPGDWSTLFHHYSVTSLQVAGMTNSETEEFYSFETDHETKWGVFSKYYPFAKNTAYIKSAEIAIKDIYGIERIDIDSMLYLTAKMRETVTSGFNRRILQEIGGIDYCVVNSFDCDEDDGRIPARLWGDTELLRPEPLADTFIVPSNRNTIARETGVDCSSFDGWLEAIDTYFETNNNKFRSVKFALAYLGHLDFEPNTPQSLAESVFDASGKSTYTYAEARPMVDFLFFYILEKAREYRLAVKFHTGIYSGAGQADFNAISGNVRHLTKLAVANPDVKIIAMHIAYPYHNELVMAIKQIANLYADMSWIWAVDPAAASNFLRQAVTAAPINKITGFGGDYAFVENAYGHLQIARRGIAQTLSELAGSHYIDQVEAIDAGRYLLRDSAALIYG